VFSLLLLASSAPAHAQWQVSPFVGVIYDRDEANCQFVIVCDKNLSQWGIAVAGMINVFGFEEELVSTPQLLNSAVINESGLVTFFSNLLVAFPTGPVRPYAVVGIGPAWSHAQFINNQVESQTNWAWDVGGGLNVFFIRALAVRGDIRHVRTLGDLTLVNFRARIRTAPLDFWRMSAGLTVRF
jgi:hypothetical protein